MEDRRIYIERTDAIRALDATLKKLVMALHSNTEAVNRSKINMERKEQQKLIDWKLHELLQVGHDIEKKTTHE